MPDEKKLAALEGAGYVLRETCRTCVHLVRPAGWVGGTWGSCGRLPPTHGKHTDGARVSVHTEGWCPQYEVLPQAASDIVTSGFVRFIPKEGQHGGQ